MANFLIRDEATPTPSDGLVLGRFAPTTGDDPRETREARARRLRDEVEELAWDFAEQPEQVGRYVAELATAGRIDASDEAMLADHLVSVMGVDFAERAFGRQRGDGVGLAREIAADRDEERDVAEAPRDDGGRLATDEELEALLGGASAAARRRLASLIEATRAVDDALWRAALAELDGAATPDALFREVMARVMYHHRALGLGWWATHARLAPEARDRFVAALTAGRHPEGERHVVGFLCGARAPEDQLELVRGLAEGLAADAALAQAAAFEQAREATPPAVVTFRALPPPPAEPTNLADAWRIAEHWQLGLDAFIAARERLYEAQVTRFEREAAKSRRDAAAYSGIVSAVLDLIGGSEAETAKSSHETAAKFDAARIQTLTRLTLSRAGQTAEHRLRDALGEVAARARVAKLKLDGLTTHVDAPEEGAVRALVADALIDLAWCRAELAAREPEVAEILAEIEGFDAAAAQAEGQSEALRVDLDRGTLELLWERAATFLDTAVASLSDVDWQTMLEAGLEVAGTVLTGGALLAVKIVAWLAKIGQTTLELTDLFVPLEGILGVVRDLGGETLLQIFTGAGVVSTLVGLLFGKNPLAAVAQRGGDAAEGKVKDVAARAPRGPGGRGIGRLVAKIAGVASRVVQAFFRGVARVAGLGDAADLTQHKAFRRLAHIVGALLGAGDRLRNVWELVSGALPALLDEIKGRVGQVIGAVRGALASVVKGVGAALAQLEDPTKLFGALVSGGLGWLLGKLAFSSSAVLRAALKGAGVTEGMAGDKLKEVIDGVTAQTPVGPVSDKIAEALATSGPIAGLGEQLAPVEEVARGVLDEEGGVMGTLDQAEVMIAGLDGGSIGGVLKTVAALTGISHLADLMSRRRRKDDPESKPEPKPEPGSGPAPEPQHEPEPQAGPEPTAAPGGAPAPVGAADLLAHLKAHLLDFSAATVDFDALVAGAASKVDKKARQAADHGLSAFFHQLITEGDAAAFLRPLYAQPEAAVARWLQTIRRFAQRPMPQMLAAVAGAQPGSIRKASHGSAIEALPDAWVAVQKAWVAAAGLSYLAHEVPELARVPDEGGEVRVLRGPRGLTMWLDDPSHAAEIQGGWQAAVANFAQDSVFARVLGPEEGTIRMDGPYLRVAFAEADEALGVLRGPLPTFEKDAKGVVRAKLEGTLSRLVMTGDWRRLIDEFLLPKGGWEGIGKQMGPRFAPSLLFFRTWICHELDTRFGAKRTGSATGFTSDEDLNFEWSEADNAKGGPPATRITAAEAWMVERFGPAWGKAFDIAFQLPAATSHLYTELDGAGEEPLRAALLQAVNAASVAVNMERMALTHQHLEPGSPVDLERSRPVFDEVGLAGRIPWAAEVLAGRGGDSHRHLGNRDAAALRVDWDAHMTQWMTARPEAADAKRSLARDIAFCQLALARLNDEAYAAPGGVKMSVTTPILDARLAKADAADRPGLEATRAQVDGLGLDEALASVVEDRKSFSHQTHLGDYKQHPKLALLVDPAAAAAEHAPLHPKPRRPAQAPPLPAASLDAQTANRAAAGFRYNVFKYAYRLINVLGHVKQGKVVTGDKVPVAITGVPADGLNAWLSVAMSAYKRADDRELYQNFVRQRLDGAQITDGRTPLPVADVRSLAADVGRLQSALDAVVKVFGRAASPSPTPFGGSIEGPGIAATMVAGMSPDVPLTADLPDGAQKRKAAP